MIEKMTRYDFVLLSSDKESFLADLRELGVVDIKRSDKAVDGTSEQMLEQIRLAKEEIRLVEKGTDAHLEELLTRAGEQRALAASIRPWGDFDPARIEELGALGVVTRFYCCPRKQYDPAWEQNHALQIISEDEKTLWFVVMDEGESNLPLKEVPAPACSYSEALAGAESLEAEIEQYRKLLEGRKAELPALEAALKERTDELNLYLAASAGESAAEQYLSCFEGYAPQENRESILAAVQNMDVIVLDAAAAVEDNPPIKLRNNKFVSMFEMLTDMYGRPAYDGFDPTPFISIFFMLFFAFCMGDAGYGLILIVLGLLLKKVKSFASFSPLVVTLGAATTVIGFLFHTFFSCDIATWAWIPDAVKKVFLPSKIMGFDGTMVLSIIVGIVHISLAMIVKTVMATRNKGFLNSLSTWGWTLLIVGGVVVGLFSLIGVLNAAATKWVIIVLGVLSALGIFLLNNLHRNPLLNIGSGLWETYNTATGLLGDVLSYLRLYALGLAGSMLGLAFNSIGMMIVGDGSSVLMWIPAVLVFIVGHTLNIAMAALGAFVHPLRLNFLEFFKNSGYEANGQKYNPLKK